MTDPVVPGSKPSTAGAGRAAQRMQDEQEEACAEEGDHEGTEVEAADPISDAGPGGQATSDEGAEDADHEREEAALVAGRDDRPRQPAGEETHHDPAEDAHTCTLGGGEQQADPPPARCVTLGRD